MKMILTILAVLAGGAARADDDCFVPMTDWQPRAAVVRLAEANGWTLRRIRVDDGCYALDARDGAGRRIEVTLHPATLEVIEVEAGGDDDRLRLDGAGQGDD